MRTRRMRVIEVICQYPLKKCVKAITDVSFHPRRRRP
jgi:hypothetical protein